MQVDIIQADYHHPQHQKDIPYLLNSYACDPMGGGEPLTQAVQDNLVQSLAKLPHAFSVIAYVNNQPAGLINCFEAFSTFACKPLVNIHDIIVLNDFRRHGLCQKMLEKVTSIAQSKGCCKLTLEVLSNNEVAKQAYKKFGFDDYQLDPSTGHALFWQKKL